MLTHINLLGLKVTDCVTGFSGVVTSVSFDLYGCIQSVVTPPVTLDGKNEDARWFDVARLTILDEVPVMPRPDFVSVHGPERKPAPSTHPAR